MARSVPSTSNPAPDGTGRESPTRAVPRFERPCILENAAPVSALPLRYQVTYFHPHWQRRIVFTTTRTAAAARRWLGELHDHPVAELGEIWDLALTPEGDRAASAPFDCATD